MTNADVRRYNRTLEKRVREALVASGAVPAGWVLNINGMHVVIRTLFSGFSFKRGVRVSVADPTSSEARAVGYTLKPRSDEDITDAEIDKVVKKIMARVAVLLPIRAAARDRRRSEEKVNAERRTVAAELERRLVAAGVVTKATFVPHNLGHQTVTLTFAQLKTLLDLAKVD